HSDENISILDMIFGIGIFIRPCFSRTVWYVANANDRSSDSRCVKFPRLESKPVGDISDLQRSLYFPTFRNWTESRINALIFFVTGEAEVNEPLAVQRVCHRLQSANASLAILY